MAIATERSPSPPFLRLAPRISLYTPTNPTSGQLVVICTWLGAGERPITRYTTLYQKIAPNARILLIESAIPILVSSYPHQREAIKPAAEIIRAVLDEGTHEARNNSSAKQSANVNAARILLHTFSNGGTNSATQLLIVLREQRDMPLPLFGLVCDSGPAMGTYWKSYNAMVFSLPKDVFFQIMGPVAVHVILCLLYICVAFGRYAKPEDLIRNTLLGDEWVTTSYPNTKSVCYIFSRADKMVEWTDILEHGKSARSKGWHVKEVFLEDSAHCNHISKYEQQYVEAVRTMWKWIPR